MKIWSFVFVLFVVSIPVLGQSDNKFPIKISGIVFDEDSLSPLPNVHLRIENRNVGTVTNLQGRFEAYVKLNDTIKFTYVGYKQVDLVISDTLLPGDYVVGILLSRDTILMKELVIVPRRRDLRNEILNMKVAPDPEFDIAKRNLAISSYQGIVGKGIEWNSDESYKMVKMRQEMAAMNQGLVAPNEMVAINFLAVIPFLIYKMTKEEIKPPDDVYISENEYELILENYRKNLQHKGFISDTLNYK